MTVTIPACEQHEGIFKMTVTISDYCPKCGKKRGVNTIHKGFSYDGSRRLTVDCWTNPCGHVDKYSEVREEVKQNVKKETEKKLKKMFHGKTGARKCKDIKLLEEGLRLSDGSNGPYIEEWFYIIHDRLDYLDPTGEEI